MASGKRLLYFSLWYSLCQLCAHITHTGHFANCFSRGFTLTNSTNSHSHHGCLHFRFFSHSSSLFSLFVFTSSFFLILWLAASHEENVYKLYMRMGVRNTRVIHGIIHGKCTGNTLHACNVRKQQPSQ